MQPNTNITPAASTAPGLLSNTALTSGTVSTKPIIQMKGVQEIEPWLKLLFYGASGVGKTTLACSSVDVPAMESVFLISAESGELSLHDNPVFSNIAGFDYGIVRVNNIADITQIYGVLYKHIIAKEAYMHWRDKLRAAEADGNTDLVEAHTVPYKQARSNLVLANRLMGIPDPETPEHDPKIFNTVIVDSLTEIEKYNFNQLLGIEKQMLVGAIPMDNIQTAEWGHYRKNLDIMSLLIRGFRDLPCHVIQICQETLKENETNIQMYMPALSGQLRTIVPAYFDIVGRLITGYQTLPPDPNNPAKPAQRITLRNLVVQADVNYMAKNRRNAFQGRFFDNPTMRTILEGCKLPTGLTPESV